MSLTGYAGRYSDPWCGDVTVSVDSDRLTLRFERRFDMTAVLEHWQYDTFYARWTDRTIDDAFVTFWLAADGSIAESRMAPVSPLADPSYDYGDVRLCPKRTHPPAV